MRGKREWHGYGTLSKPLAIWGVERRVFILIVTFAAATWQAMNSFAAAVLVGGVLYGAARWAWSKDPNMLEIVRASGKCRARYDPGKWSKDPWRVQIRR